ncbi:hypothetical protein [Microbacterium sp.]|uniref:hypothetical protein n=1 Tax=Microbacterium sp. TaxID=51671 RepID=UPI0039E6A14C
MSWSIDGGGFRLEVTIPNGVEANHAIAAEPHNHHDVESVFLAVCLGPFLVELAIGSCRPGCDGVAAAACRDQYT